jgi:hypothetical protein
MNQTAAIAASTRARCFIRVSPLNVAGLDGAGLPPC